MGPRGRLELRLCQPWLFFAFEVGYPFDHGEQQNRVAREVEADERFDHFDIWRRPPPSGPLTRTPVLANARTPLWQSIRERPEVSPGRRSVSVPKSRHPHPKAGASRRTSHTRFLTDPVEGPLLTNAIGLGVATMVSLSSSPSSKNRRRVRSVLPLRTGSTNPDPQADSTWAAAWTPSC